MTTGTALAVPTDIANAPLFTSSNTAVKPNMMFILDDSGSMADDYLPDSAGNFDFTEYGRRAAQCNGVAYDPTITYQLPVDSLGATVATPAKTMLDPAGSDSGTSGTTGSNGTRRSLNSISAGSWPKCRIHDHGGGEPERHAVQLVFHDHRKCQQSRDDIR